VFHHGLCRDYPTADLRHGHAAQRQQLHDYLQTEKERNGWTPRITIADWTKIGPGHAILIEPDGRAIASPVWSEPECLEPFGNLYESSAAELWNRFPYKQNHLDKYLERTMIVL
jgi:hypothetical protein